MVLKIKNRRIQTLSKKRDIYFVYLPKEWVERWNLDKNRIVTIIYDKELTIIPKVLLKPRLCRFCIPDLYGNFVCIHNLDAPRDCSEEFCPFLKEVSLQIPKK